MMHGIVARYLKIRRTGGFALKESERHLADFAKFAGSRGETVVRSSTAIEWAAQAVSIRQRQERLRSVVLFARFLHGEDPRHEIPPVGVFDCPRMKRMPHIYTRDEAQRLVDTASSLVPVGSNRGATMSSLLALMFASGLRISEALALSLDDFRDGSLLIRQTKFRKTRLVPLHTTAVAGLSEYIEKWRRSAGTDAVFVNIHGRRLTYKSVEGSWREVRAMAKLQKVPGRMGPRIHDIRHTFAVRALEAAPNPRDRISQHMLAVSTYLGHANVADTYWYLHASPTLMAGIADAYQSLFEGGRP
jgi:integrase